MTRIPVDHAALYSLMADASMVQSRIVMGFGAGTSALLSNPSITNAPAPVGWIKHRSIVILPLDRSSAVMIFLPRITAPAAGLAEPVYIGKRLPLIPYLLSTWNTELRLTYPLFFQISSIEIFERYILIIWRSCSIFLSCLSLTASCLANNLGFVFNASS